MFMKCFDKFRSKRQAVYERLFSARSLCLAGFLIMPALLFNPITIFRVAQFFFFWFLAWLSGKKNNPLFTLLIILGIVAFNLIVPYGRVLFSLGPFRITQGALLAGIQRAVTLEGLIMLSRASIRQDLKIPGGLGELIGESFRIFALITEKKQRITRKNFIGDIDSLMLELSGEGEEALQAHSSPAVDKKPRRIAGLIILAAVVILAWLPWGFIFGVFRIPR
jgi:heptaprenyl diphosphate synthase